MRPSAASTSNTSESSSCRLNKIASIKERFNNAWTNRNKPRKNWWLSWITRMRLASIFRGRKGRCIFSIWICRKDRLSLLRIWRIWRSCMVRWQRRTRRRWNSNGARNNLQGKMNGSDRNSLQSLPISLNALLSKISPYIISPREQSLWKPPQWPQLLERLSDCKKS